MRRNGCQTSSNTRSRSCKRPPKRAIPRPKGGNGSARLHEARHPVELDVVERRPPATLVDLLRVNASAIGEKEAFRLVRDGDGADVAITYRALYHRAMAIGSELQMLGVQGKAVLLLFPPGLDFISAFFGCLYAGVIAVPAALPARNRSTSSIEAILRSCDPVLVLSTADHCELARQWYAHLPELLERPWIATDQVADDCRYEWRDPRVNGQHTAFLQYTSGSTSSPKGVVVSHDNLLRNAELIRQAFGNTREGKGVSWLPLHHDMGLIGGVVQPIYCGGECALLAPVAFLQRPALWLETISRTGATVSGGPDFAYDLCVRRIPAEARGELDLSSWKVAFTGAERVRADTIERFVDAFGPCGFRREAFFPCYGLAEATLMVSGGPRQTAPSVVRVDADALRRHQVLDASPNDATARTLVSCGQTLPGQTTRIIDPQTRLPCVDGRVGEIWVQGPSVAHGYYHQPEASQSTFGGYVSSAGEGPFLRTGDLGFLRAGQLFVTGRLKDVIIVRGGNHYPEDIERSTNSAHADFRAGYCAAFSVDVDDQERLVVVQEIEPRRRQVDTDAALRAVRSAIATQHELDAYAIVLVKAGEIPKTSSGKTQRATCRERYLTGQLQVIAQWKAERQVLEDNARKPELATHPRTVAAGEIEDWLIGRIAARLGLPPAQVLVRTPFLEFGMSSLDAVEITAELEQWLGRQISPTAVYNYPNIAALAGWLARSPTVEERSASLRQTSVPLADPHAEQLLDEVRQMTEAEAEALILREMARQ